MREIRAFVALDADEWANDRNTVEDAARFVENDINASGGIGGVDLRIDIVRYGNSTFDDYLDHASKADKAHIYPYVPGATKYPDFQAKLRDKRGLFCLFLMKRVSLPQNTVGQNVVPDPAHYLERLCEVHQTSHAVVVCTSGREPKFKLRERDQLINSADGLKAYVDSVIRDGQYLSDPKPLIAFDDFGAANQFAAEIRGMVDAGFSVSLTASNFSDEGTGASWFWPMDSAPDIQLLGRLRNKLPLQSLSVIDNIAIEVGRFKWLYIFNQTCKSENLKDVPNEAAFLERLRGSLENIDGTNDMYVDGSGAFSFRDGVLEQIDRGRVYRSATHNSNTAISLFTERQPSGGKATGTRSTLYIFCDVLRVAEVNIEERFWAAELELECSGLGQDLLSLFTISNLSQSNFKYETELLNSTTLENGMLSEKYLVHANLAFDPKPSLFPFDEQTIGIELQLKDNSQFVIQPTPLELTDDYFEIDGWEIRTRLSGIKNRKRVNRFGPSMLKEIEIVRTPESQWVVRRSDSRLFVRSVVPLGFLFLLSWYSTLVSADDLRTALSLNTTAFLSSIALLFALDRPKVPGLTLIDKIFLIFHLIVGTITVGVMLAIQSAAFYSTAFPYLKYFPLVVITILGIAVRQQLKRRV
jgi:hypothetical protein